MPRCSVIWAIYKRNLGAYFSGALGFLFILAFVVFDSLLTFSDEFFANNLATLDELTAVFPLLLLFFVPAITMGIWSEERKQGTDELLFTMPATDVEILLGKYLAAVTVFTIALGFASTKVAVLAWYADPDLRLMATTFLGYWLSGVSLIAAGMFASALIPNTTAAFVLGVVVCAVPVFVDRVAFGSSVVESLSMNHHLREFGVGLVPLGGLLYFLSLVLFSLYLNFVVITRRHWSADRTANMALQYALRIACLLVVLVSLNFAVRRGSDVANLRVDATAEGLHTLSDATRTVLRAVPADDPVEVRAFVSSDLPRDHLDQGRALERLLAQYDRLGGDAVVVETTIARPHTDAADEAESFGITPRTVEHEDATGQRTDQVFLGAVVTGPRDEVRIPYLVPTASVEYELTRAIASVTQRQRTTIGLVNTPVAEMMDNPRATEKAHVLQLLEKHYDVETIFPDGEYPLDREVAFELWTAEDAAKSQAARERAKQKEAEAAKDAEVKEAEEPTGDDAEPKPEPEPDGEPENGEAAADGDTDLDVNDETDGRAGDEPDATTDEAANDEAANGETSNDDPTAGAEAANDEAATNDDPAASDEAAADAEPKVDAEPKEAETPEEPPRTKPDRRSQHLETDPAADLDSEKIPDELRTRLEWRGVPLSSEAEVTVHVPGSLWAIGDVNPAKTYTVRKDEKARRIVVTYPRFDVVVAVVPSELTAPEMGHLVAYVETGRPVLIFDDPLPLHVGGFLAFEHSPLRPRQQERPQSPGMPAPPAEEKADGGRAKSLAQALGIVWEYDEIVWDEFDPHPNHRELPTPDPRLHIPLMYVSRENGTSNAFSNDSAVTAGLQEMQFIHPGRINPLSGSDLHFEPLVRVGPDSGWYRWSDLIETARAQFNPFMPQPATGTMIQGMVREPRPRLDLALGFFGERDPTGGVRVVKLVENSRAAKAGLEQGDRVVAVSDGRNVARIRTFEELEEFVGLLQAERPLTLAVERTTNGNEKSVEVEFVPERNARFCLAGHVTAPRRIKVSVRLPIGDKGETAKSVAEKLEAALGKIAGIASVSSETEQRAGRKFSVTTLVVADEVPTELPDTGATGETSDGDEAAGDAAPAADAPLDVAALVRRVEAAVKKVRGLPRDGDPRVERADGRNAIFVADVDLLGIIPFVFYGEDPEEDVDFRVDNATFVVNAIDVLAGREELVRLRGRRARHRIIGEVERQTRRLDAAMNKEIRAARASEKVELEEFREKIAEQQRRLDEAEGGVTIEEFQEVGLSVRSARSSLEQKIERIERETERTIDRLRAENRRKVVALQNRMRVQAITYSSLPVLVLGIVLLVVRLLAERSQFDPTRSRRT